MIVRGVVIEAPAESLKKVPPTANQLDVLATLRIRKHVSKEAFYFGCLAILEKKEIKTAYDVSTLIGWWTSADIGARTKLLLEVAQATEEAGGAP